MYKKILVIRNDRFGEFLLNIPAIRALKETFGARISLVVNPYVKEIAHNLPFVDEIIEWNKDISHSVLERFRFLSFLKKERFALAIILNPSKEFNIFSYLAGIPTRVGYNHKYPFLLTKRLEDRKYLGKKHEVEYNLELVGLIGARTEDRSINLPIKEKDKIFTDDLLKKTGVLDSEDIIAIHPWTSDPVKQWPLEYFGELASLMNEETALKVIIIGGRDELEKSKEFFRHLNSRIINLTARFTLGQLAAFLKRCTLLVSNDSGPVHLAAAVGTKVLAIFRSDICAKSSRRWGPWGKGHIVLEKDNLEDIGVDEVYRRIKTVI
jgi:ADP-heptose:LPS heptosyltransferase